MCFVCLRTKCSDISLHLMLWTLENVSSQKINFWFCFDLFLLYRKISRGRPIRNNRILQCYCKGGFQKYYFEWIQKVTIFSWGRIEAGAAPAGCLDSMSLLKGGNWVFFTWAPVGKCMDCGCGSLSLDVQSIPPDTDSVEAQVFILVFTILTSYCRPLVLRT